MARRLEPTVLLAAISPITIALVAGAVALTLLLSGSLIAAIVVGIAVYVLRVLVSRLIASRVAALPRRIDPFALREPWRFFVRDAIRAQTRFTDALTDTSLDPCEIDCWRSASRSTAVSNKPGKLRNEVNNSPTHADGSMGRDFNANSKASVPPTLAAVGWRPSSPPTAASPNARNAHETSLSRSTCGSMKQWPG